MEEERKKVAIAYDADKTLLRENHPNLILRARGIDVDAFWEEISRVQRAHKARFPDSNPDIYYLSSMAKKASQSSSPLQGLTIAEIEKIAKEQMHTLYYPGIPSFFQKLKDANPHCHITHNIVSLGVDQMLRASELGSYVDRIFANSLLEDPECGLIVAGTNTSLEKDSAIKKISRGKLYGTDKSGFEFPISQMICIGDGDSDKEMFRQILRGQGLAICVYDGTEKDEIRARALAERIKGLTVAPSDYTSNSPLVRIINERLRQLN